jgi:hypothetical protein
MRQSDTILRVKRRIEKPDWAKFGKRMSFGSNFPGVSIPTDRWELENIRVAV